MALQTITYDDKSYLNQNSEIADVNKVNDTDMNEIKSVVNNNATELIPIVLYTSANGTAGNITLDDDISNYSYYEIYFSRGGSGYSSLRMTTDYLDSVSLVTSFYNSNLLRFYMENISISGTTLTVNYGRYLNISDASGVSTGVETSILIYKVIGYK